MLSTNSCAFGSMTVAIACCRPKEQKRFVILSEVSREQVATPGQRASPDKCDSYVTL